jgi:hypothetical protein
MILFRGYKDRGGHLRKIFNPEKFERRPKSWDIIGFYSCSKWLFPLRGFYR